MSGGKRKHDPDSPGELYSNKSRSRPSAEARVDPTYGQRSALPGLDDENRSLGDGGDLEYDDDLDALSYLRAVRQEATSIPNLLVAPKEEIDGQDIFENGVGDYRGLYGDGAYYACPESSQTSDEDDNLDGDGNLKYFDSILNRYDALCTQLNQTPPVELVARLDKDHPTHVGALNTSVARWWRWKMRTVDPVPAQVATMNKSTVLRLLGLLTGGKLLQRGLEVEVGISRWAWSLLARLPARGELTSEEIGVVRELGKKAVLVGMGLKGDAELNQGMDAVEARLEGGGDDDILDVVNEAEIPLNDDDDIEGTTENGHVAENSKLNFSAPPKPETAPNRVPVVAPVSAPPSSNSTMANGNESNLNGVGHVLQTAPEEPDYSTLDNTNIDDLEAAKTRILNELKSTDDEDKVSEELAKAKEKRDLARWNTKATADMIITVAGEISDINLKTTHPADRKAFMPWTQSIPASQISTRRHAERGAATKTCTTIPPLKPRASRNVQVNEYTREIAVAGKHLADMPELFTEKDGGWVVRVEVS
ncbi:hypothetical protein G7Y89_g13667 [Cudoniella acicularis]|uniref:Uncharacterized protein n=1 Tax=Cudoniella acicularis TaxID=354080 RepID=A0A8H4R7T6_9HELO|nr:hypothetical protein G7Y89_g13667 [Cudoniella acicularis]